MHQAQAGDAHAYGLLYERLHPYIRKILNDDVREASARNDILQSVFELGWSKIGDLRDPAAFRPWLAQIARRKVTDHYRVQSRTVPTDFSDPVEGSDIVSQEWSAHDWSAMHELARSLEVGIRQLGPRDTTVLELATTFGFNAREIAAALDIDAGHARVLLHRARQRLSKELAASHAEASE